MQVTTSSSPLFSSWDTPDSQGPAAPEPSATMGLAGQDIAPAAPNTLVGYNKPLLVDDGALTLVGHNKPLLLDTIAAPGTTAANSPTPKADPLEIAALELLLAEPATQDMVQRFGGSLLPLPTGTDTGQGIQARYGADLGARLNQLQTAQQAVRAEYCKAMDSAMQSPAPTHPAACTSPQPAAEKPPNPPAGTSTLPPSQANTPAARAPHKKPSPNCMAATPCSTRRARILTALRPAPTSWTASNWYRDKPTPKKEPLAPG